MLKEKLYADYQQQYYEYADNLKNIELLKKKIADFKMRADIKRKELKEKWSEELSKIEKKKQELEKKLIRFEGVNEDEYLIADRYEADRVSNEILTIQQQKVKDVEMLQIKKKKEVERLTEEQELCQKRLASYMTSMNSDQEMLAFDESTLRKNLGFEKDREIETLKSRYDRVIDECKRAIQNIDNTYAGEYDSAIYMIENNTKIIELGRSVRDKELTNDLPQSITKALDEPVESFTQRHNIANAQRVIQLASAALPLESLEKYTPRWLIKGMEIGIPIVVGIIIFIVTIVADIHLPFVASAANAIVTIGLRILCVGIGFGIIFGILTAIKRKKIRIIGGILGGIISLLISFDWSVRLPNGIINTFEWGVKIIICFAIAMLVALIISNTGVKNYIIKLGMRIGYIKDKARMRQEIEIQERVDSYYAILKYREIMQVAIENCKYNKKNTLNIELERLQKEKKAKLENYLIESERKIEDKVAIEKSNIYESNKKKEIAQRKLIQVQDDLMIELSTYDEKIKEKISQFDALIDGTSRDYDEQITRKQKELKDLQDGYAEHREEMLREIYSEIGQCETEFMATKNEYEQKLSNNEAELRNEETKLNDGLLILQDKAKRLFENLASLFDEIYGSVVELEEAEGVLPNAVYIYNEAERDVYENKEYIIGLKPVEIIKIEHNKKPIVFLYKGKKSIATELYELMDSINLGFYMISCSDIFNLYITDPLSEAIDFKEAEDEGRLERINDINKLYSKIKLSMEHVASNGHNVSIDELNSRLVRNKEKNLGKYGKYNIVQFIIPAEDSPQTTDFFNSAIWTKFETSNKHGFLPIFYINEEDWKNSEENEDAFRGKFISKLRNAIGDNENIWVIKDPKTIKIAKY